MSLLVLLNTISALEGGGLGRFDYARLAAMAAKLIEKFGQDGQVRVPGATGASHNPTPGTPTDHPAKFVITSFDRRDVDGTRVLATDKKALVAAKALTVEPTTSHRLLEADGKSYSIAAVETLKPATTPLVYVLQVRR